MWVNVLVCIVGGVLLTHWSSTAWTQKRKVRSSVLALLALGVLFFGTYVSYLTGFFINELAHRQMEAYQALEVRNPV